MVKLIGFRGHKAQSCTLEPFGLESRHEQKGKQGKVHQRQVIEYRRGEQKGEKKPGMREEL